MNYPEELRERFNDCMYDERDIIGNFLKDQYDIRYGRQRDTWHFEPAVKMLSHYGNIEYVTDIMLDKDRFVIFVLNDAREYECFDFAYGELSKVIEALPNAEDVVRKNATNDLKVMTSNLRIDYLLNESPFKYEVNGKLYTLDDVKCVNGTLSLVQALGNDTSASDVPTEVLVGLRDHINIEVLHRSNEYKELMELLSLEENMRFECHNFGDAEFEIDETDMTVDVAVVQRDDKGNLVIYGADLDEDEDFEFTEKDIKPRYLASIIECIKPKYSDIMDTYNSHNAELVRKINAAWKDAKYHNSFSEILLALLVRDHEEYLDKYCEIEEYSGDWAMKHAHEIMEGVCDDWDLETILSFIRYKE